MSELYRLVYASKNLLPGSEADKVAAVAQILATSQSNNAAVAVTGALMFNGGAFAQVLEGPREGVEVTLERIQRDERHGDVTVLQCGPVESRAFANWSMAFVGQSATGQALWNDLAAESGFELSRLDGDAVFSMLHALVLEEEGLHGEFSALPSTAPAEAQGAGFDHTQVRREIAQLRPGQIEARAARAPATVQPATGVAVRPAPQPMRTGRRSSRDAADAALAVFKAALASERQRTTELRAEIDELRVALAANCRQHEALCDERDLWAERARALATVLCREADDLDLTSAQTSKPMISDKARPVRGAAGRDAA